jgi:hypothetical protein
VSAVKYELGFYIPEDTILHSHRRENLKSYILLHARKRLRLRIESVKKSSSVTYILKYFDNFFIAR